jgi:hypothetical protein
MPLQKDKTPLQVQSSVDQKFDKSVGKSEKYVAQSANHHNDAKRRCEKEKCCRKINHGPFSIAIHQRIRK